MTFTIGRASLPVGAPAAFTQSGDRLDVEGIISPTTANDTNHAAALRQQLSGLVDNPDEDVFPLTYSGDATFDGFYRVTGVSIDSVPALSAIQGVFRYRLSMERVASGHISPRFEVVATQSVMTNSHSLPTTSNSGRVAVPGTALTDSSIPTRFSDGAKDSAFYLGSTLTASDGTVKIATLAAGAGTSGWQWSTPPAYFYEGSARFEQSYNGTYYTANGQQVRAASSNAWRISNGLIRATINTSGVLQVSLYDGSQWETAADLTISGVTYTTTLAGAPLVRVLRNSPEGVVVRVAVSTTTTATLTSVDLMIRRGCRWVAGSLVSNTQNDWYVQSGIASTALTGGFKSTAADAGGNKLVLACTAAQTNTLASGRLKLTSTTATSMNFVVGYELNADASGQDVIDQWVNGISERQRVVPR